MDVCDDVGGGADGGCAGDAEDDEPDVGEGDVDGLCEADAVMAWPPLGSPASETTEHGGGGEAAAASGTPRLLRLHRAVLAVRAPGWLAALESHSAAASSSASESHGAPASSASESHGATASSAS